MTLQPLTKDTARRPFLSPDGKPEREAWLKSALGRRRRSHTYRRWAREAEAAGDLQDYRDRTEQADHTWRLAKNSLAMARREYAPGAN